MKIKDVLLYFNKVAPFSYADSYDNPGLIVGDPEKEIHKVIACLDITNNVVNEALERGADLIVSHHPVIFNPIKKINPLDPVYSLIKNEISAIAVHTNFDIAIGGVNDTLIKLLGFKSVGVLETTQSNGMGYGAVCDLVREFTPKELAAHCKQKLALKSVKYSDNDTKIIKRAGVCSGSGGSNLKDAYNLKCDALITGDIKHKVWIEAENLGMVLIDAGHYGTEKCAAGRIADILTEFFNEEIPVCVSEVEKEPCEYL